MGFQDAEGFFRSRVVGLGLDTEDANGFVTVQVLRALGPGASEALGAAAHDKALAAIMSCRTPATGGFRFWPSAWRPVWAPELPDDADDTVLMLGVLYKSGLITRVEARRIACRTIVCHRLGRDMAPGPAWRLPGAYKTWMDATGGIDMADCTVNANILGLLATLDLATVPGYGEASAMIAAAVDWAGDDVCRAASLSPFYPEPGDLALAVDASVQAGAESLCRVAAIMRASPFWRDLRRRCSAGDPAVCGSPYGLIRWHSQAVGWARRHS